MKADAHPKTPTRGQKQVDQPNAIDGFGVLGSSLLEIGWQLALGIVVPLWLVSVARPAWLQSSWFSLIIIWIAFVFISVVYLQLKKLPKKYGGLK